MEIAKGLPAKAEKIWGQEKRGQKRVMVGANMIRIHCVLLAYNEMHPLVQLTYVSRKKY